MPKNDLIDKVLDLSNMNDAWERVRANKGAPGPDGWNLERWARSWQENIERIRHQVKTNTYRANPPRRIVIRKPSGGFREICLFNVSDRVLQRAVLNIIDPIFDMRFLDCSHGYRAGRSCATAIQQVINYRNKNYRWVLDADIESCFDRIDHTILSERIGRIIRDWFILNLMSIWLKAGIKKRDTSTGIPQGAVVSPIWCNIYLHNFDAKICCAGWKIVRYADDFVILTESYETAQQAQNLVENILLGIKLRLSPTKTRISSFDMGFRFLGVDFLKDTISYVSHQKRIQISGNKPKVLFRNKPAFYSEV